MAFAPVYRNAVSRGGRKGPLGGDEIAEAKRLRGLRMSWSAVARALNRSEPDVRAACEPPPPVTPKPAPASGGLSLNQLGVLRSSMGDESAAMVLGRSLAWVRRQRAELAGAAAEPPSPPPSPEPVAAPEPEPAAPAPAPPRAPVSRPAPPPGPVAARGGEVVRVKPLKPAVARWARGFLAAGWPLGEIAWLFDLDPEALAIGLEGRP